MTDDKIDIQRFKKSELLDSLELMLLGFSTTGFFESLEEQEKEQLIMDYLAIKKAIRKSGAL